jgi:hypothetical protein
MLAFSTAASLAVLLLLWNEPVRGEPVPGARPFEYALPVNAAELGDAQLARTLDVARAAGVDTITSGAVWWYLNEGRPPRSYDWSSLDRLVAAAESRGMEVHLQLSGTPDWVHPDLENTVPDARTRRWTPPRTEQELGHWSNYVHDVVSRYRGRVVRYEIWNEQNIGHFWKPEPNPGGYAALLRAAYFSAKSADPGAVVCFGGLASNDLGYLKAYYAAAENRYPDAAANRYFFDVLGIHPYSTAAAPDGGAVRLPLSPDRETPSATLTGRFGEVDKNFLGIKRMKSVMDNREVLEKSIFLGEYGFTTTDTSWVRGVPDYRRALYLKRAYALARALPYVAGLSWYYYRPSVTDGPEWSIVDSSWNPSLTYRALKQSTGAESTQVSVTIQAPGNTVTGVHRIEPTLSGLQPSGVSRWEIYVDGALKQTTQGEPIAWNTTNTSGGAHELMVAAYTTDGSVWPSNIVPVTVENAAAGNVVAKLGADASSYDAGDTVELTATLSADVETTVDQLSVAVRPEGVQDSSQFTGFYDSSPYTVETSPKTVISRRAIDEPGDYVAWVSYYRDGSWRWLEPEEEFTVERPNTAPQITAVRPKPGSTTRDRTPTLAATVRDAQTNLAPGDIKLRLDGRPVPVFAYRTDTDRLTYTPQSKISLGRHTVAVVAHDVHMLARTRSWTFRIVR